jgi:D-amino-acid dehydrogenase
MDMTKQARKPNTFDVMVLGAGIVGVSTAIHLHRLGLDVALVDWKHPGGEASFGNAGIVQRNGFTPHAVPTHPQQLLGIFLKQSSAVSYDLATLVRLVPWLRRYHLASSGERVEHYAKTVAPLRALVVQEHLDLARSTIADRFYRTGGWLHVYRNKSSFKEGEIERYYARVFGVDYQELASSDVTKLEPGLKIPDLNAVHWTESCSVSNPGAVVDAFWRGYVQEGGAYFRGDARKLQNQRGSWSLECERGSISATNAVIALGSWSMDVLSKLGETYPLAVKRGYHMHFQPQAGVSLSRPVVDVENGFAMTPTEKGIRLTTGVELAERDAPPNPNVIKLARRRAEELFPLGKALQDEPWLGSRPCLPDSLPIVGASPKHKGLWFNFGHAHDGFTFGPVTGRVLAELISNKTPIVDPSGLSPARFAV